MLSVSHGEGHRALDVHNQLSDDHSQVVGADQHAAIHPSTRQVVVGQAAPLSNENKATESMVIVELGRDGAAEQRFSSTRSTYSLRGRAHSCRVGATTDR